MAGSDEAPPFTPIDPYALARSEAKAAELKRFYKDAAIAADGDAITVLLDGRAARTPARRPMALPSESAAALVAAEWNAQGETIRPGDMPMTRLVNAVIDGVARAPDPVRAEILRYAGSDLLCYRAETPVELVERQAAAWDPVLAWMKQRWNARLYLAQGVIHVTQPDHAMQAIAAAVTHGVGEGAAAAFRLGSLHVMTTLSGSALLGLALMDGALEPAEAWGLAHVDEDYQIGLWGEDAEAADRRERRWRDFAAAAALAAAVAPRS